jgi:hypothetical protein
MSSKSSLLEQFQQWIAFVQRLEHVEENWNVQLGEGKWSVTEVVSHIMLWDRYFLEEAIEPIHKQVPLTVKHLDYDIFNENAKRVGQITSPKQLSEQAVSYRKKIMDRIQSMPEDDYVRTYLDADGHPFQLEQYLKDFIWHDDHHMDQMKPFV